jgi:phosphotransferase system enzyme I (PtsI)
MEKEKVLAIVTETGGETSHMAILAKGFGIPALLGIDGIVNIVKDGEEIIVDAVEGFLVTNPTEEERCHYSAEENKFREKIAFENRFLKVQAVTLDGVRILVKANIGSCAEEELKAAPYTDGVGLLRTEFLYMQNDWLPGENDQFRTYSNILGAYKGKPVILRTIDVGGDKQLPGLIRPEEPNPFLGCRALRLCFAEPELFKAQLRAAFRASVYGELWIMFPMVSSMEDIRRARDFVARIRKELDDESISMSDNIKFGIMIEIPAIALIADQAVKEIDFASIGTNDLCQYMMAADRMNPHTEEYYQPCHPAMLRLIRSMAEIFRRHGKTLGVCGEMASDTVQASLLLGLGITSLSVNIARIAAIKSLICGCRLEELKRVADFCCDLSSAREVQNYCSEKLLKGER